MSNQPERPWLVPDPWEVEEDARRARRPMTPEERVLHRRNYHRAYRRRQRYGTDAPVVGWLHELRCNGNHHGSRICQPIPCFEGE